jgi:hypothetical protein
MPDPFPGKSAPSAAPQRFQSVDADAVCEQCGTVNDEGTLLCRVCGQNLRDQRARRLAGAQAPAAAETKVNRVRIFTGLLSIIGILLVVILVISLPRIEAGLTEALSEEPIGGVSGENLWSGPSTAIYEELLSGLRDYPSSRAQIQDALENPIAESSYNGRYVLLRSGALTVDRVVGEAALQRRGDRVYFVALMSKPVMEIRGSARLEEVQESDTETPVVQPVVRNSAGYLDDAGVEVRGFGVADPLEAGGHRIVAMDASSGAEDTTRQAELFAFRIR